MKKLSVTNKKKQIHTKKQNKNSHSYIRIKQNEVIVVIY